MNAYNYVFIRDERYVTLWVFVVVSVVYVSDKITDFKVVLRH